MNKKQSASRKISDFNYRFWIPCYGPAKAISNFGYKKGPSPMYDAPRGDVLNTAARVAWFGYTFLTSAAVGLGLIRLGDYIGKSLEVALR